MADDEGKILGQYFSRTYLATSQTRSDDPRARHRISAYLEEYFVRDAFSPPYSSKAEGIGCVRLKAL